MLERNDSGASEMLAPTQRGESTRTRGVVSAPQSDVFVSLKMPFGESAASVDSPVTTTPGTMEVIHVLSDTLSSVIRQGKAALLQKNSVGFLQPGFEGLSIRRLVDLVEVSITFGHAAAEDETLSIPERIAAFSFADMLEDFQYCLFGLDFDSLGRSDTMTILPALEKLKQVCMKAELELVMDMAKAAQES